MASAGPVAGRKTVLRVRQMEATWGLFTPLPCYVNSYLWSASEYPEMIPELQLTFGQLRLEADIPDEKVTILTKVLF